MRPGAAHERVTSSSSFSVLVKIYEIETEKDRLLRKTIETQLEATRWPGFPDIDA